MKSSQDVVSRILASGYIKDIFLEHREDIAELLNAFLATIYVIDKPRNEIYTLYRAGSQLRETRYPVNHGSIVGFVAGTGRGVNIADVYDKAELGRIDKALIHDESWDKQTGCRTTQMLALPIRDEGTLFGVIQIVNRKGGGKFTEDEQGILEEITGALYIALSNQYRVLSRRKTRFDYLVNHNLMKDSDLQAAFTESRRNNEPVEELLMKKYRISREDIGRTLEDFYRCRYIHFNPKYPSPDELLRNLKREHLRRELWVPLEKSADGRTRVIVEDPNNLLKKEIIENLLRTKSIEYCVSLREDIIKFINYFYDGLSDFEYWEIMERTQQKGFAPACKATDVQTKDTLADRLRALRASPRPMLIKHTAAMCYDTAFPPDRIEYVCPSCGEKTLYARREPKEDSSIEIEDIVRSLEEQREQPYYRVEEIESCRKAIKDIKGLDCELDESQFCRKCRPDVINPVLLMKVHWGNICKITPGIRYRDLLFLSDFMEGTPQTLGGYEALADHLPWLEELLGVKSDG